MNSKFNAIFCKFALQLNTCTAIELVIHKDLKFGNLFINYKMEVKIGDFGLAIIIVFDGER